MKQEKLFNSNDIWAFLLVIAMFILCAKSFSSMDVNLSPEHYAPISLDVIHLPKYILLTTTRLLIGIIISIIFSIIYATIAAKNATLEKMLVPLLDVFQSVPVLGYISFTVTGFISLFPGSVIGVECAVIFAIFTAQVWNITISIYQSLKSLPKELEEVCVSFNLNKVQKFFRVELPYAIPGIIWNMIVSMSAAWFFIVASEVIAVGSKEFYLPGIGAYISSAIIHEDLKAIFYAIGSMFVSIIIYDQLLMRPLTQWSTKFRYETSNSAPPATSFIYILFRNSITISKISKIFVKFYKKIINSPFFDNKEVITKEYSPSSQKIKDYALFGSVICITIYYLYDAWPYLSKNIDLKQIWECFYLTSVTLLRIILMVILAILIWVPLGVMIGLYSKKPERALLVSQMLSAFPTNLLYPIFVILIHNYFLDPNIWLSFLLIFGSQWYVAFNVISGSSSIPNEFREVYKCLDIRGFMLWKKIILPAIFPKFLNGAFAAWGGAWNATIVAELVNWGHIEYKAYGIGSFIAESSLADNLIHVAMGIAVMTLFIILFNKFFWQPLFNLAERKYRLE